VVLYRVHQASKLKYKPIIALEQHRKERQAEMSRLQDEIRKMVRKPAMLFFSSINFFV
jgi:hypothetical protein